MKINERPSIIAITPVRDGYTARALCLVDGFPAEVHARVDMENQRYSEYWISVWNADTMEWSPRVYQLSYDEVGHMPPLMISEQEARQALDTVAELLWHAASVIVTTGRKRLEELTSPVDSRVTLAVPDDEDDDDDDYSEVTEPLASDAQLADLRAKLAGDA